MNARETLMGAFSYHGLSYQMTTEQLGIYLAMLLIEAKYLDMPIEPYLGIFEYTPDKKDAALVLPGFDKIDMDDWKERVEKIANITDPEKMAEEIEKFGTELGYKAHLNPSMFWQVYTFDSLINMKMAEILEKNQLAGKKAPFVMPNVDKKAPKELVSKKASFVVPKELVGDKWKTLMEAWGHILTKRQQPHSIIMQQVLTLYNNPVAAAIAAAKENGMMTHRTETLPGMFPSTGKSIIENQTFTIEELREAMNTKFEIIDDTNLDSVRVSLNGKEIIIDFNNEMEREFVLDILKKFVERPIELWTISTITLNDIGAAFYRYYRPVSVRSGSILKDLQYSPAVARTLTLVTHMLRRAVPIWELPKAIEEIREKYNITEDEKEWNNLLRSVILYMAISFYRSKIGVGLMTELKQEGGEQFIQWLQENKGLWEQLEKVMPFTERNQISQQQQQAAAQQP